MVSRTTKKAPVILCCLFFLSLPLFSQTVKPDALTPEVILLGTAHDMHFRTENHYSLIDLRNEVEALRPDVICGEITADAYQQPMEGYFPPEAAYLAEIAPSLRARFVPTDWRITHAWQSRAEAMEPKKVRAKAATLQTEIVRRMKAAQAEPTIFDFMHKDLTVLADRQFEDIFGENTVSDIAAGGWHERNRRIVENCLDAASNSNRIVIAFGAGHIPQLQRQLAARNIKAQVATRLFSPSGLGTLPPAVIERWRNNLDNLKAILGGRVAVPRDSFEKVKDSHRIQDLELALKTYAGASN